MLFKCYYVVVILFYVEQHKYPTVVTNSEILNFTTFLQGRKTNRNLATKIIDPNVAAFKLCTPQLSAEFHYSTPMNNNVIPLSPCCGAR